MMNDDIRYAIGIAFVLWCVWMVLEIAFLIDRWMVWRREVARDVEDAEAFDTDGDEEWLESMGPVLWIHYCNYPGCMAMAQGESGFCQQHKVIET